MRSLPIMPQNVANLREKETILPLIREKVNSLNCQYHCMNIIMDTIGEINPSQTSVDVCDQPIYALTKQLQWRFPRNFRKYFCLFGGLHVEKCLLVLHSDFIKGSGLPEVLGLSGHVHRYGHIVGTF